MRQTFRTPHLSPIHKSAAILAFNCAIALIANDLAAQVDLDRAESTLIPKRETGVIEFLEKHPTYDGRDVVIAIFDTGVDPAAHGLQTTTTGERKIVDIIDGSGAGDVDMSHTVQLSEINDENPLIGLTGRPITLPAELQSSQAEIRLGMKRGRELFHSAPWNRLMQARKDTWKLENNQERAARKDSQTEEERAWEKKHPSDRNLEEKNAAALDSILTSLEESFIEDDPGPIYDCIVWAEGDTYKAAVDTNENGDFNDETVLRPFGIAGEYGRFADPISATFGIQVYDSGQLLSIVTVSGSHGTHVAAIAAAHFPEEPIRNGIAPGAKILSVRLGDIRTGGSSNYFGEMRAVASAAQHQVDIMNASWGGVSTYQDGQNLTARLYNKLVQDYGVTAFVSAGNNGPALSTLGSPGGEAERIIGVGAYVSGEMGKYLYALAEQNPDTAYGFTSRGPARNGDLGVDIFAPGGATATLASDSLRGAQLYNGTSMAAPSAAGVGALLVSATKQLNIKHSPDRIKAALMNTAVSTGEDAFAEGAGLIQALPALQFLKEQNEEPAWDIFYDLEGWPGTFRAGPGFYLREKLTDTAIETPVYITPTFPESMTDSAAYDWETNVVLKTTAPWLIAPEYLRIANGRVEIDIVVDATQLPEPGIPAFAKLTAHLADDPAGHTLFQFPVTVVEPQAMSSPDTYEHQESINLESSSTRRIFLEAPERADHLELKIKLKDDQTQVWRRFVFNVLSLADESSFRTKSLTRYIWLEPGEEKTLIADVFGGQVVEITLHQYWSTPGTYSLDVKSTFHGTGVENQSLAIPKNYDFTTMRIQPINTLNGEISATLDASFLARYPEKTERFPGDQRMQFPAAPRQKDPFTPFRLRQTFSFDLEEEATLTVEDSRPFNTFNEFGGDLYTIYDATGDLAFVGAHYRMKPTTLGKGTITVHREIISFEEPFLDAAEDRPLMVKLKSKIGPISVFPDTPSIASNSAESEIELEADTHQTFYLKNTQSEAISKLKNSPDFIGGEVTIKNENDDTLATLPLWVQPGDVASEISNPEPKPKEHEKDKEAIEEFEESIYQKRMEFVSDQIKTVEEALAQRRDTELAALIEENSEKAELYLLGAKINATHARLIPEFLGRPKEEDAESPDSEDTQDPEEPQPNFDAKEAILTDLAKARELSAPEKVAQFFGAKPASFPGDTDQRIENKEKETEMKEAQSLIAETWLWQAAIAVTSEDEDAFKHAYIELQRWETEPSENTTKLLGTYYEQHDMLGLSLEQLNTTLEEDPSDTKAFEQRIMLYKKLGWDRFADRDALKQKLREATPLNLL
ncbi:MAG: S8 family serine peptidase [Verrucomicrobiota bacterium]